MKSFLAAVLLALAWTNMALAAVTPQPGSGDSHVQSTPYDPQQVVVLKVAPGYALTVEFSSNERVENIAIGNGTSWQITPNKLGDRVFIKSTGAPSVTNLTIVTGERTYLFELNPVYTVDPSIPYFLRFTYPPRQETAELDSSQTQRSNFTYRFSGAKDLRPADMWDDGKSTYITWGPKTPLAAIYKIDAEGHEALINGGFRDGRFVVDDIASSFVFRLGEAEARADRKPAKVRKK